MKLLNASTWEIRDFISDDTIPRYAILSHTWGVEEVTFHDWQSLASTEIIVKQGYEKIRFCCNQAVEDGLEWVWIDTCCIDKSSSAELSEAINSMFRWYHNATVCYAYLGDVSVRIGPSKIETCKNFSHSRWFTRGWTLQELLAPADIIFYSKAWKSLGNKFELLEVLSSITGIEEEFLRGKELGYASISKKMSWAAGRNTSRAEDIAYCLIGIFDINMPLIYGEGKKAFQRLQLELMRVYPYDHTLFAWGVVVEKLPFLIPSTGELPPWNQSHAQRKLLGPLAESPRDFESSASFVPSPRIKYLYQDETLGPPRLPTSRGLGVQFEGPAFFNHSIHHWGQVKITQIRDSVILTLFCLFKENTLLHIGIPLQASGKMCWGRTREIVLQDISHNILPAFQRIEVEAEQPSLLGNGDIIIRRMVTPPGFIPAGSSISKTSLYNARTRVISNTNCGDPIFFYYQLKRVIENQPDGFAVIFRRLLNDDTPSADKISVWVALTNSRADPTDVWLDNHSAVIVTRRFLRLNMIKIQSILTANKSKYHHVMESPIDSWVLDTENLPKITVNVERHPIVSSRERCIVDVVDLIVTAKDIPPFLSVAKSKN